MAGIVEAHAGRGRWSPAQSSSACALVPLMSERKPPSQNMPGAAPGRAETAMARGLRPFADLQSVPIARRSSYCSARSTPPRCGKRPMPSSPPRRRRTMLQIIPSAGNRRRGAHHDRHRGGARRTRRPGAGGKPRRAHGGRAQGGRRRTRPHAGRREKPGGDGDERLPARGAHPARACRPRACQEPRSRLVGARSPAA